MNVKINCFGVVKCVMVVAVSMLHLIPVSAQGQDGRKVYSGELKLYNLQDHNYVQENYLDWSWGTGHATYEYFDKPGGGRILDGKFEYVKESGGKVEGMFVNNKQTGLWLFQSVRIYFEDGIPTGEFAIGGMKGTVKNGKVCSSFVWDNGNLVLSGNYNNDGKPVGTWHLNYNKKHYSAVYDNYGNMQESWHYIIYDETTGDKEFRSASIDRDFSPEAAQSRAVDWIRHYLLRDSRMN